jgi:DNA-binding protein H-NS
VTTLETLMAQKAALEKQIADLQKQGRLDAIAQARVLVAEFELTQGEVFKTTAKAGGKVAPKYRDPDSGKTWTGRGVAPKWIAGKDRDTFLIG